MYLNMSMYMLNINMIKTIDLLSAYEKGIAVGISNEVKIRKFKFCIISLHL